MSSKQSYSKTNESTTHRQRTPPEGVVSHANGAPKGLDLVLRYQCDHCVRSNTEIKSGEARPKAGNATRLNLLCRTIKGSLERHLSRDWIRLHFLDLGFDEVKGQAEKRGEEACNSRGAECLNGRRGSSIFQPP